MYLLQKIINEAKKMSGVTKHIYDRDIFDIKKMWDLQLKTIIPILPREYSEVDVLSLIKEFYPHEWKSVEYKYEYYNEKDKHILRWKGHKRYNMPCPENLLKRTTSYKRIFTSDFKNRLLKNYSDDIVIAARNNLSNKRRPKIDKVNTKISSALEKTQQLTPTYIDKLTGVYSRKTTSQKDKVYILAELKKYYSPKIIQFFFKLNDTELNKQLRNEAFKHLQSFNYQPRLRKQRYIQVHTKNKKRRDYLRKEYANIHYSIPQTPQELQYRIENSKEQQYKRYDYFISHSSKDREFVQKLITYENSQKKDVFCDWINDVDYLKRHLLCDATLDVLEKRMEQSDALLFVQSENSLSSIWCRYELNYFKQLGKPIYVISTESIIDGDMKVMCMHSDWYVDQNYKQIALVEGTKIVE